MTQSNYVRETHRYGVIAEGRLSVGDEDECRIERLYVKDGGSTEVRFSWWKNRRFIRLPLHATEPQLLDLFNEGIRAGVFTPDFRQRLRQLL